MEEEQLASSTSSMMSSQETLLDSFHARQDPSRNAPNSQDLETFEIIETDPPARENDDIEDLANESFGEDSDVCSVSDESDLEQTIDDEDETPVQRLARVRNHERRQLGFPANLHVIYIGRDDHNSNKHAVFSKISESISQIFWDEAENAGNDIRLEKRLVICPVSNVHQDGRPQIEYYQDSGVSITEADLTNGPYTKAFEYLQRTFAKADQGSSLVDLCVVFIPQDASTQYGHFRDELLPALKKLQEKVTLLPIITSNGQELTFNSEREEKRQAIVKSLESKGIEIFAWKADQLIEDRETVYTKKILFVNEFIAFENQAIYEDLQILRSRAIKLRKDRRCKEQAKRRAQEFDRIASILKDIIIKCMIAYTVYLFLTGVWNYAEWSVIPSDLASSLQVVSRASLKTQNQNGPQTISLDNKDIQPIIEVFQESSSRFVFDIKNKKEYARSRKDVFEVIVTHNPPQILGHYDVQEIDKGRYAFDIDITDSKGEVLVEIKEKNGSTIKTVPWVDKGEEKKEKNDTIKEYKDDPTFFEYVQDEAANTYRKVISYSADVYEVARIHAGYAGEELYKASIYVGHQLGVFYDFVRDYIKYVGHQLSITYDDVRDYIDYWAPIVWKKVLDFTTTTIESIKERYLKIEERVSDGIFNLACFIKDQYDEIYTSF